MAFEHVQRRWRFREARIFGSITPEDLARSDELNFTPEERPGRILVDLTASDGLPERIGITDSARRIESHVDKPPRTAFIASRPVLVGGLHQMIQFLGAQARMRVFATRAEALGWLSEDGALDLPEDLANPDDPAA